MLSTKPQKPMKRSPLRRGDGKARLTVRLTSKCKVCKQPYDQFTSTQIVCSWACGGIWAQEMREKSERAEAKAERAADKAQRERLKSRAQWLKEAQTAFNAWVRARDAGKPCISCQRTDLKKINAGHYLSTGARPELRFEPLNVHLQCEACNTFLSGDLIRYRINLRNRIGAPAVEWLEGPHEPKKYTADQLKALRDSYRAMARALVKGE